MNANIFQHAFNEAMEQPDDDKDGMVISYSSVHSLHCWVF